MIIIASLNIALAQSNFSESFINISKTIQLHVPTISCVDNKIESNLTYKTYTGKLSMLNTYYADVNMNLNSFNNKNKLKKHVVGIGLLNEKEGNYFNKTRFVSRYALHLAIDAKTYLAAGFSLNIINYNFHSSNYGASGSDFNWAGTTSLSIYGKTYNISLAYNDFNKPTLQPIDYKFKLNSFMVIYGQKSFYLSPNTQLNSLVRCNILSDKSTTNIFQTGFVFSEIVGVNGFYNLNKGYGFIFDINKLKMISSKMDFSLAYYIPNKFSGPSINQFEFNLKINVPKP